MKKEKTIRTYQRKTKSGKVVTVRQHTAKYDATDELKKTLAKKKGAGNELEEIKKTKSKVKKVEPIEEDNDLGFTAAEFKEWYQGTGSAADKKVAKALRAKLGRSGYRKFEDEAIDNYTPRGHNKMFKSLGSMSGSETKSIKASKITKTVKDSSDKVDTPKGLTTPKAEVKSIKGREVPQYEAYNLTKDSKLPKGVTVVGNWVKTSSEGVGGMGGSSHWGSKPDVYEANLSNGQRVVLKRTYGPLGETKVSFEGASNKSNAKTSTSKGKAPSVKSEKPSISHFEGDEQLKHEIAIWKKSPTSASGKASRNNITRLLKEKESKGYTLTKKEKALL